MSVEAASVPTGRAAAILRRRQLSQGKAALPPPKDRLGAGFRLALRGLYTPPPATVAPPPPVSFPEAAATVPSPTPAASAASPVPSLSLNLVGRDLAVARRRLLSQGKAALQASSAPRAEVPTQPAAAPPASTPVSATVSLAESPALTGRELAIARRSALSRHGRAALGAGATVERPKRQGSIPFPPKVVESRTASGVIVTGYSEGVGRQVTGTEAGREKPISGTPFIGQGEGAFVPAAPKVGHARTPGGLVVSGTMVRSRVRITGDEASATRRITGEADQTLEDDLSARPESYVPVAAQFQRQANPHGHSVFGTNLGRSIRHVGSRERPRQQAVEVTEGGAPITGSAVGRSVNVTGDEPGACRTLTGTQYLTPARRMEACSGPARTPHPMAGGAAARRDPVTGRKVHEIATWGGQRVTGTDIVEHMDQVTGDEPGECRIVTGTPYLGPNTTYGYCEPDVAAAQEARLPRPARAKVTGDVPMHEAERVTGTERGAERSVTGTPYWREDAGSEQADAEGDPVARAAAAFSIRTPAREAHLERREAPRQGPRITGSFAVGEGKLTGNVEFGFVDRWSRKEPGLKEKVGHQKITGHGSVSGYRITGSAWDEHSRVTGTEGYFATVRNPTVAQGDPHGFAGARTFKRESPHKEPRRLVTGVIGWTPKSAAIVTLSGGAQG